MESQSRSSYKHQGLLSKSKRYIGSNKYLVRGKYFSIFGKFAYGRVFRIKRFFGKVLRSCDKFCQKVNFYVKFDQNYSEVSNKRWHHLFIMRHFSPISPLIRNHHLLNLENFTLNFLNSLNKKTFFPLKDAYLWKTFINFHEFWLLDIY